jgi:hypothetical protein
MIARASISATFAMASLSLLLPVVSLPAAMPTVPASLKPDGGHDFDFEIGTWNSHLSRLIHPLSGSAKWADFDGTTVVRKVWNGRANLVELEVQGSLGHIEALSLRLYNPKTRQWSLNFANGNVGELSPPPAIGEFNNGRGEFYDDESFNGKRIKVRFVISNVTQDTCRFEQAYSEDGGKTWEINWIATDTRLKNPLTREEE